MGLGVRCRHLTWVLMAVKKEVFKKELAAASPPPFLPLLLRAAFKPRCSPLMLRCSHARAWLCNLLSWIWTPTQLPSLPLDLPHRHGLARQPGLPLQQASIRLQIRKALVSPPLGSRCLCLGPSQWCPPWPAYKSQTSAGPARACSITVLYRESLVSDCKAGVEKGGDDSTVTNGILV